MRKIVGGIVIVIIVVLVGVLLSVSPKQKQKTVAVITFVDHPVLNTIEKSFRSRMQELYGSHAPKIQLLNAQGRTENLPSMCKQILQQKPDIVLTISTPVTQALMREADKDQKVVYTFVTNPSDLGDELTRTNSTGLSDAVNYAANLKLIRDLFGPKTRIGMLYNPNEANSVHGIRTVESLVPNMQMTVTKTTVVREADIPSVVSQLASAVDVIYVGGDNTVVGAIPAVVRAAEARRVPVFASDSGSIENGAAAGVSVDYAQLGRLTADVVKKVLDGTEPRKIARISVPGDKLLVNRPAAKRFNVKLPAEVLKRASFVETPTGR
jgi:putative ABC transport system substrate-binding protein